MILNLEDCLEHLAGLRQSPVEFTIEKTDYTIITSIARQCFKGTALTDRQSALMHEKLQTYRDQFINLDWDFDYAVNQLRQPVRHIDRSKYIKLVDNTIVVRFPFRKTEIMLVQEMAMNEGYSHDKGSHKHIFAFTEVNILNIIDRFKDKEFIIDQELLDLYRELKDVHDNPQEHLSGITLDNKLINIKPALLPIINSELGDLTNETFIQFVDRKFRYGLNYIAQPLTELSLVNKIANRLDKTYQSQPSKETTADILNALWKLNRFPMLVVLDENNAEKQLYEFANHYRDIIDSEEQSVLFRLEEKDAGFNQLIKDRKLNNWVDKNTKLVYISNNKLPKLLVNNEWKPTVAFSYNSKLDKFVNSYISFNCDLIVYREETISPFRRYSNYYG